MSAIVPKIQNRDPFFDSLKVVLIFFVVLGHTLQYTYGEENIFRSKLFLFIYTFHMPLFIFISGYLSKNISPQKFVKSFPSLFVTYLIFQVILSIPKIIVGDISPWFIFQPEGVMWYIACLIIWRLLFSFIPKRQSLAPLAIIISFAISFLAGFYLTGNMLTRACTFLPYFALGLYCSTENIQRIRKIRKTYAILFLSFIFIVLYEFAPKAFIYSLYGDVLYSNFMVTDNMLSVTTIGAMFRIISYFLAISIASCIICLTPNTFAKWGSKTLYVYLLHAVFVYLFYYTILDHFEIKSYVTMHFIVALVLICATIYISRFKIVQYIVDPVNNLFRKKK